MSVEDLDKVDFIGIEKDFEKVVLTITDHLPWGNKKHLEILQEKINAYLRFIESGEIYDVYPMAQDKNIKISIRLKYKPDEDGEGFLNKCAEIIASTSFEFDFQVF